MGRKSYRNLGWITNLVRKDYLDVPANQLVIDENTGGITTYFDSKISVNSEYNLYTNTVDNTVDFLYTPNELAIMISLDSMEPIYEWHCLKV